MSPQMRLFFRMIPVQMSSVTGSIWKSCRKHGSTAKIGASEMRYRGSAIIFIDHVAELLRGDEFVLEKMM